jgi:hypothetical protein
MPFFFACGSKTVIPACAGTTMGLPFENSFQICDTAPL